MTHLKSLRIKGGILAARARDTWIPASPQKIRTVLALCGDRYVSAEKIAQVIVGDYGLTFKLFRLMNSAFFSIQRKDLLSVRYMVVLLGLENLARAASKTHVAVLKKKRNLSEDIHLFFIAQGIFASRLASALASHLKVDQEKASVMAMFRNLGDVISALTVPDIVISTCRDFSLVIDERRFKRSCGGYTPERLGLRLARNWNMPYLIRLVICPSGFNLKEVGGEEKRLFILSDLTRELIVTGLSKGKGMKRIRIFKRSVAEKLDVEEKTMDSALLEAGKEIRHNDSLFSPLLESQGLLDRLLDG